MKLYLVSLHELLDLLLNHKVKDKIAFPSIVEL